MASIHKLPGKPNWICYYTDRTGARKAKSTLTKSKREAQSICAKVQAIEDQARTGFITREKARRVIENVVNDIMRESGSPIERKTVSAHFTSWLKAFESEQATGTYTRYKGVVDKFITFLGARASRSLAELSADDIQAYRDYLQDRVSAGTVNVVLKVLRVGLESAVKQGVFDKNPARLVDNLSNGDKLERRAFSLPELRKLMGAASDDWRSAVMLSLYGGGLRLGDVQALTWANFDFERKEMTLRTQKTGRVQIIPLCKPLLDHIEKLPTSDDPQAPLCPRLQGKSISTLSNEFYAIMASVGLVPARADHQKQAGKAGRSGRRTMSTISFHALRHTATSLLKNAGVTDVVARDLIGHESESVSRNYTHIDSQTKRDALNRLPAI